MNKIKYVIGYVDSYDTIHHKVVYEGDRIDSHLMIWPGKVAAHGKFRWSSQSPKHLNTYGEDLPEDIEWLIWDLVENALAKSAK